MSYLIHTIPPRVLQRRTRGGIAILRSLFSVVVDQHTELGPAGPGIAVGVGHVGKEPDGVPRAQQKELPGHADLHLAGKDGDVLLGPAEMGLGGQGAGGLDDDAVGLEEGLLVKGEDGVVQVFPVALPQGLGVRLPDDADAGLLLLHQRGEGHPVPVGDLPQDGDGGVDVPLLDLGQHAPGDAGQFGGGVQGQLLLLADLLAVGGDDVGDIHTGPSRIIRG